VHDVSDGGLLIALAEMAMAGDIGLHMSCPAAPDRIAFLFGEDQARYVLAVPRAAAQEIVIAAASAGISASFIGETGGATIRVAAEPEVRLETLKQAHESWFPRYMGGGELPPTN